MDRGQERSLFSSKNRVGSWEKGRRATKSIAEDQGGEMAKPVGSRHGGKEVVG